MEISILMLVSALVLAVLSAFLCAGYICEVRDAQRVVRGLRQRVLDASGQAVPDGAGDHGTFLERLLVGIARTLPNGEEADSDAREMPTRPRTGRRGLPHAGAPDPGFEAELVRKAGFQAYLRPAILQPLRIRVATLLAASLVMVTLPVGTMLSLVAFPVGILVGYRMPDRVLMRTAVRRRERCRRDLPVMLDIIALGSAAGLSFDASFELYAKSFDTPLARACHDAYLSYAHGAMSREEALKGLVRDLDIAALRRFVDTVRQSMRFGTPLSRVLRDLSAEERGEQRAKLATRAAKAPVRMLIPMGTLILPAMLILVLGPVMLSMAGEVF